MKIFGVILAMIVAVLFAAPAYADLELDMSGCEDDSGDTYGIIGTDSESGNLVFCCWSFTNDQYDYIGEWDYTDWWAFFSGSDNDDTITFEENTCIDGPNEISIEARLDEDADGLLIVEGWDGSDYIDLNNMDTSEADYYFGVFLEGGNGTDELYLPYADHLYSTQACGDDMIEPATAPVACECDDGLNWDCTDYIYGNSGNDVIYGGDIHKDIARGYGGDDMIDMGTTSGSVAFGGAGTDTCIADKEIDCEL
jgi:hypothetical protein